MMDQLLATFAAYPWFFYGLSFVFAAVIGSFLNVVIHRLPIMMKRDWHQECLGFLQEQKAKALTKQQWQALETPIDPYPKRYNLLLPHSACPKCGNAIKPWQNLPIIGWLTLKGQCDNCQQPIAKRYPLIEALSGLLVTVLAWHFGATLQFAWAALLTFYLIALTFIDLDEMLLPDQLTLPLLWLGILLSFFNIYTDLSSAVIGAIAGYLSLWSVYWGFKLLTGKEGMGYGDFKLMAVFGAWLGWQQLPMIILMSSLVGAIIGISLILFKKHNAQNPIPFGPYIAIAGWLALVFSEHIAEFPLLQLF